jgi:hypothetical protein
MPRFSAMAATSPLSGGGYSSSVSYLRKKEEEGEEGG